MVYNKNLGKGMLKTGLCACDGDDHTNDVPNGNEHPHAQNTFSLFIMNSTNKTMTLS